MLIARVSGKKYGVRGILEGERLGCFVCSVDLNAKLKGHRLTLKETRPNHAIRSSVAITKLPLGCDIRKKKKMNLKMEKCDILEILFLWIFKLSGLVIVHTASLLAEEHSKSILWTNFV